MDTKTRKSRKTIEGHSKMKQHEFDQFNAKINTLEYFNKKMKHDLENINHAIREYLNKIPMSYNEAFEQIDKILESNGIKTK